MTAQSLGDFPCLFRVELIAALPFALGRLLSRPGAHWGSQYQVGAAIFLSASKAWEKTRSHREHGIALKLPPGSSLHF